MLSDRQAPIVAVATASGKGAIGVVRVSGTGLLPLAQGLLGQTPDALRARHATLPDAVAWCFDQARDGDAVLLSPACASLDMFRNYAHRAEVFIEAVQALAQEEGVA